MDESEQHYYLIYVNFTSKIFVIWDFIAIKVRCLSNDNSKFTAFIVFTCPPQPLPILVPEFWGSFWKPILSMVTQSQKNC